MHRKQVIADLVLRNEWTAGAELGLWDGRTFLYLLKECPDLTLIGVDAWVEQGIYKGTDVDGNIWNHSKHERKVREGAEEFGDRAEIVKASTTDAAPHIADKSLDFVFIDADHSAGGVYNDILGWRSKLKETGRLMGHDINWESVKTALRRAAVEYEILPDNVWMQK